MKLLSFFILVSVITTMAANSYSQQAKFNISSRNVAVREVLQKIEDSSEFIFLYSEKSVDVNRKVDVDVTNQTVNVVLDQLFNGTKNYYEIRNRQIAILEKGSTELPSSLVNGIGTEQQSGSITGKVVDISGSPLPGVTVMIKGTTKGVITDIDGKYLLSNVPNNATIVFSFVGMKTQEISVKGESSIDVKMVDESVGIEEVVAIGYGVQKKSVITGAISGTNAKELENQPLYRVDQALQGRVSGVSIASSSGQPGASSTVRVRGTTSINSSDPLYVIDGTPIKGNIDYLNQNDIESIEVLKDAASAAIYGARSAAGVILVTTKMGKSGEPRINYNGYYGLQNPAKKLGILNATEYATLYNEMLVNGGKTPKFSDVASLGKGTDWQAEVFANNSVIQNHDISISGASDKVNYYTSFGYYGQDGIILPEMSYFKRYNFRLNVDYKLKNWIKVGEKLTYSKSQIRGIENNDNIGILAQVRNLDPITPVFETDVTKLNAYPYTAGLIPKGANGKYYSVPYYVNGYNPLLAPIYSQGKPKSHNLMGNFYVEMNPIKNLTFKSAIGVGGFFSESESYNPPAYYNSSNIVLVNTYSVSNTTNFYWNLENTVSYNFNVGKHNFMALAGMGNYVDNILRMLATTYKDIPAENLNDASLNWPAVDANKRVNGLDGNIHKVNSIYGRFIYNYDEKYLFTGILRRDGSSRFGTNNKFGYFPSASLGWVVSREGFWGVNNLVDFFKIRGSYGETGSDNIGDFKYVSVIQGNRNYSIGNQLYLGNTPEAIANPDLKWETTSQLNIGFDATLKNNLRLTFDWFNKKTTDMLMTVQVPAYSGAGNPIGNVASMKNTGYEIDLDYHKSFGKLNMGFKGNVSHIKNEVTDIGDNAFIAGGITVHTTNYEISRIMKGFPFNSFYGFESDGIFQTQTEVDAYVNKQGAKILPNARPGDFRWKDLNGDGTITINDRKVMGNSLPTWSYGLTITAEWRNWDMNIFGQGVAGNKIFQNIRYYESAADNWTTEALGRWHGEGTSNTFPILLEADKNENFLKPSQYQLSNGAFFRLKSMQIGYSLPKSLLSKFQINKCRIYLGASNLLTITKYKGYDPEIGSQTSLFGGDIAMGIDRGVYPQARSFMMGLNITF